MASTHRTIFIEPLAPTKPALGAPCNGCGVCCLAQPCPIGMVLSRRRHGACVALHWDHGQAAYRCGAVVHSAEVLARVLPGGLHGAKGVLAPVLSWAARRSIALDKGCDCDLEVDRDPSPQAP